MTMLSVLRTSPDMINLGEPEDRECQRLTSLSETSYGIDVLIQEDDEEVEDRVRKSGCLLSQASVSC
jgi:hypothetical protein